jgi:hypothetical protein
MKQQNLQGIDLFSIFHFYTIFLYFKCHILKKLYAFFTTICPKKYSKIHSYEKQNLGKKTCNPYLK